MAPYQTFVSGFAQRLLAGRRILTGFVSMLATSTIAIWTEPLQPDLHGDASRAGALLAAFSRSVETAQPYFTRKDEKRHGSIHSLRHRPRLCQSADGRVARFGCHSRTVRSIGECSVPSDHRPVWLTMESLRPKQQDHPAIQSGDGWFSILFVSALHEEHRNMICDADPLSR